MRITVVAVGKLKERFWADACAEYLKRLKAYARVTVTEVADVDPGRAGGVAAARAKEGEAILAALPEAAHVVLMAIEGKQRSSEGLSRRLDELALSGRSDIAFVIGGSDGVSSAVYDRADETLSLEAMEEGVVPEKASRDCKFERFCTEEGCKSDRMTAASGQNPR